MIKAAIVNSSGVVIDTILLENLGQSPGAVLCPDHIGVGMLINTPAPIGPIKAAKLASLETSRKQAIDTLPPVTVSGKQYPATPEYREVISGLARRQAAGRPIPSSLRGANGLPVTLTPVLLGQIDDAIATSVQAQWDKYWTKFDAVQAATASTVVDAITW